ncbi:MAG TPA: methyltransferase domain-containing protein [Acidimicrobiia bacterium]|nr:methyltransferase domain-containing protein [Acidimicrobiia bacterium]
MSAEEYTIQGGREGKRRLEVLGTICDAGTGRILDRLGSIEGFSALDVGCGGGNVTLEIARRVGPSGRVVGIDFDVEILELARLDAKAAGLEHVEFRRGDARAPDGGPYDLVSARFVLSHLADPQQVVSALAGALAPGGFLVLEDTDWSGMFTVPTDPVVSRGVETYRETLRRGGGDGDLGQRLPHLVAGAGLEVVALQADHPLLTGPQRQLLPNTLRMMEPHVIGRGVTTPERLDALVAEYQAFIADPAVLVGCPRVVQIAGRKSP